MRCFRRAEQDMEIKNYGFQQDNDGHIIGKFRHCLSFSSLAEYGSYFQRHFFLFSPSCFSLKEVEGITGCYETLWEAITRSAENCTLWYANEDRCLIFFKFDLFNWYWCLYFIAMRIRIKAFELCVSIQLSVVAWYVLNIYVILHDNIANLAVRVIIKSYDTVFVMSILWI